MYKINLSSELENKFIFFLHNCHEDDFTSMFHFAYIYQVFYTIRYTFFIYILIFKISKL